MSLHSDTIDLADVARAIRHGWREVLACVGIGVIAAAGVILWAPRRFDANASLVIRESSPGASLLSRIGLSGDAGSLIPGGSKSALETELQIIGSRAMLGRLVDSLGLQTRLLAPSKKASSSVLVHATLPGEFKARKYEFTRGASGMYTARTDGDSATAKPGTPMTLGVGTIVLRADTVLPSQFTLAILDREDAITYAQKHLTLEKAGGEVVRLGFGLADSVTPAKASNALAHIYLAQRTTNDRGNNAHRVAFLTHSADSAAGELTASEEALRREQERSGIFDPVTLGKAEIERASELRGQLTELDVEAGALDQLLKRVEQGSMSSRQLAAFPTFIKSPGISQLLSQISTLDAERQKLLATRTEADPEVVALTSSIKSAEDQLLPIARSYSASITRQRVGMQSALDSLRAMAASFPKSAEAAARLQRDVIRNGQIYAALQAQLVGARLAAIDEGGDARQLDVAEPPKKPAFPEPITTMGLGLGGGLFVGLVVALFASGLGRWARDPIEVERITGVPSIRFDPQAPLLMSRGMNAHTVVVLALDADTSVESVARRLADTATARAVSATILDLTGRTRFRENGQGPQAVLAPSGSYDVNGTIARLEGEYGLVIVQLADLSSDLAAAVLNESRPTIVVAPARRVDRARLANTLQTLKRLEVPCAGVVMSDGVKTVRDVVTA